jgi:branched-chain amino acid transport system ATP-binding protein
MELLKIENLEKHFGGIAAVDCLSLHVRYDEILGLIGPNGSGKTTVFNLIGGVHEPSGGQIYLEGAELHRKTRHEIVKMGIGRTFQGLRHFSKISVFDNIMVGCHCRTSSGLWSAFWHSILKTKTAKKEQVATREKALELIEFLGLSPYVDELAENIPQFMQRRLDIGVAMATEPSLLLLDEPAAGLNATETIQLDELINRIRTEKKTSVFLIEHDMKLVMDVCERIIVLNYGKKIAEGTPREIQDNEEVVEAYLGKESFDLVTVE